MYGWVMGSGEQGYGYENKTFALRISYNTHILSTFLMKIHLCEQKKKNDSVFKGSSKINILITLTEDAFI